MPAPKKATANRPPVFDRLASQKKRTTVSVDIALDPEVAEQFAIAKGNVERAQARWMVRKDAKSAEELAEAEDRLDSLRTSVGDSIATFVFRSLGRPRYRELVEKYPAEKDTLREAQKQGEEPPAFNIEKFAPALMHACAVQPDDWTLEQWTSIWTSDDWSVAELTELFSAAVAANTQRRVVDLKNV